MNREELERIYNLVTPGRTVAHYVNKAYREGEDANVKFVVSAVVVTGFGVVLSSGVGNYTTCAIYVEGEFSCTHLTDGDTVIWRRE